MSTPKRGMVAGRAIKTEAQSKEYDEGFGRTFGERKPVRGRFVYTCNGQPLDEPVEVGADFQGTRELKAPVSDLYMDGVRSLDGVDIGSRAKRREYMHVRDLTDADDYKQTWSAENRAREASFRDAKETREIREHVGRALRATQRKQR